MDLTELATLDPAAECRTRTLEDCLEPWDVLVPLAETVPLKTQVPPPSL